MDQMEALEAREYQLAAKALQKADKRQASSFGKGATTGAVALSRELIPRLAEHVREKWKTPCRTNAPEYNLERMLRQLEPEVVALCCLQAGLHVVAAQERYQVRAFKAFADHLEAECFSAGLFKRDRKLAERASLYAATKHGNKTMRQSAARAVAKKAGFLGDTWAGEEQAIAGVWCSNLLTECLPDVFRWEEYTEWNKALGLRETRRVFVVTEAAQTFMREAVQAAVLRRPVWLARLTPPSPWTRFQQKPAEDVRVTRHARLVKTYNNDQIAAIKRAIADGTMELALKGINALQAVPFKINSWLLGVMEDVQAAGIEVPGFTIGDAVAVPGKFPAERWAAMTDDEKRLASDARRSAQDINRQRHGDITLRALDMEEAQRLAQHPEFYLPMYMDSRGRVYALPRFHFQRGDHVRALFLCKNGAPITEKGTYWLRVHVANCWAEKDDKGVGLDKKPLDTRVQWTKDNEGTLRGYVEDPLGNTGWTQADSPFLFLAAARELVNALRFGTSYQCHLPVSFDGSCSGLQHLSAAIRATEGALVNLTDNDEPFDIYAIVAEEARRLIEADAQGTDENKRKYAQLFLSYKDGKGIDRKLLKRNCMTFCYSSESPGMGDQQYEDLMVPLQAEATRNKTPHHFGTRKEQAAAARYMGRIAYAAITSVVKKPAEAMDFLKDLAGALAHEGKPVRWVSPAGLPCVNRYHASTTKTLQLWLHNERISVNVATGDEPELLKRKCQQAIAPNFVHSLDAAHLLLTVGAAADEGITDIATVHDSFGCLPAHADRFRNIIREQFMLMYQQHDVLTSVLRTAKADLTEANHKRLPQLPEKGTLDLAEVLKAKYAFA